MPPELAQAGISYAEFAVMGHMRRNLHMLAYALDFCRQVRAAQAEPQKKQASKPQLLHSRCCTARASVAAAAPRTRT